MRRLLILAAAVSILAPAPAAAQAWSGRVLIGANGAVQTTSSTFEDDFTYQHPYSAGIPGEEASVETRYKIPVTLLFDAGVTVRVYRSLGVGVAFTDGSSSKDVEVSARIPHPLLIGAHRGVEGRAPGRHSETGIHVMATYFLPLNDRVYVMLSAGPTYFSIRHKVARTVSVQESYPYDEATYVSSEMQSLDDKGWGFNAGADLGWMFTRHFGLGSQIRFTRGTLRLSPAGRAARDIDAGGLQVGLGARVGF